MYGCESWPINRAEAPKNDAFELRFGLLTNFSYNEQIKKQHLELDMNNKTGSKLGKEYIKAVYCHSTYLTYMQSTSCEMPSWMKHKLETRLLGEISITSDMQIPPF